MRIPPHALAATSLTFLLIATAAHAGPAARDQPAKGAAPAAEPAQAAATAPDRRDPDPRKFDDDDEAERRSLLLAIIAYGAQFSRR